MLRERMKVFAQPLRFVSVGAFTAAVYLGGTLLLNGALGVPIQISIAVAYALSLILHFTLQRLVVFNHGDSYALMTHHQAMRYLLVAACLYAFTAIGTAVIPEFTSLSARVAYVLAALTSMVISFTTLRAWVFHEG